MNNILGKIIVAILAITFFPITITILIFKSDMEVKAKLISVGILWIALIVFAEYRKSDVSKSSETNSSITVQEESSEETEKSAPERNIAPNPDSATETAAKTETTTTVQTTTTTQATTTAKREETHQQEYILNTNTMKYHYPSCKEVRRIKDENKESRFCNSDDLKAQGYSPCGKCNPG